MHLEEQHLHLDFGNTMYYTLQYRLNCLVQLVGICRLCRWTRVIVLTSDQYIFQTNKISLYALLN